jgi:anti-anti-sigma factor
MSNPSFVVHPTAKGVRVSGDLDMLTAPQLERAVEGILMVLDAPTVDIDMSACTFADSAGLATLVTLGRAASAQGMKVVLWHPTRAVRRLLSLTGLDSGAPFAVEA